MTLHKFFETSEQDLVTRLASCTASLSVFSRTSGAQHQQGQVVEYCWLSETLLVTRSLVINSII